MLRIARLLLTLHKSQDYIRYVVAISINSLPWSIPSCTVVVLTSIKLSLAIYVQGKKYFKEVMHPRKYFTLNFFINEIFSVEKFPNYSRSIIVLSCYS